MYWLKKNLWKTGIVCAGILLLLILMMWIQISAVHVYSEAAGLTTPETLTVPMTPTEDATVTALNKEKLEQEVQQLKNQNAPDLFGWIRTNAAVLLSTLVIVIGGLIGLFRWLGDRRNEREKHTEERFQTAIEGLGSTNQASQVGAAITLRTFLNPDYGRFYLQIFDLTVAHLRLRKVDSKTPEPLDSLSQALIINFKESFPKVRHQQTKDTDVAIQQLDAAHVQLDSAYLVHTDLQYIWMPQSYLREANLLGAKLREASLRRADLSRADLSYAELIGTNLEGANLSKANFSGANLGGANLRKANFSGANLNEVNLSAASYHKGGFLGSTVYTQAAYLDGANFSGANLSEANLSGTYLWGAIFRGVIFYKANLSNATLHEANLSWPNLEEIDLNMLTTLTNLYIALLMPGNDFKWVKEVNIKDAELAEISKLNTHIDALLMSVLDRSSLEEVNRKVAGLPGLSMLHNLLYTLSLKGTDLRGVRGLTKEQLQACQARGAIIDDDSTIISSQTPVSPTPQSQSDDAKSSSSPSVQNSKHTSDFGESSTASSQSDLEL